MRLPYGFIKPEIRWRKDRFESVVAPFFLGKDDYSTDRVENAEPCKFLPHSQVIVLNVCARAPFAPTITSVVNESAGADCAERFYASDGCDIRGRRQRHTTASVTSAISYM